MLATGLAPWTRSACSESFVRLWSRAVSREGHAWRQRGWPRAVGIVFPLCIKSPLEPHHQTLDLRLLQSMLPHTRINIALETQRSDGCPSIVRIPRYSAMGAFPLATGLDKVQVKARMWLAELQPVHFDCSIQGKSVPLPGSGCSTRHGNDSFWNSCLEIVMTR